jgi:LysM repeat protein
MMIVAILFMSVTLTGGALAWSGCPSQVVVQWGDTMSSIASACGTTMEAILAANPGIDWWVYPGEILNIPAGYAYAPIVYYPVYGSTYIVQWGDTLGKIAASMGFNLNDLLAVNPQIWNPSLIYPGQVINLPAVASIPPPPVYYPPPPTNYPPPVDYSQYSTLTISYTHGMIVRSGPANEYKMINSALYKTKWQYGINTRVFDAKGQLWVQVYFSPTPKGYTSGWMLVRDQFGNYFTDPQIDL